MQWSDEGIILSVKPHGETAAVAEIFTRAHGRHLGLVHGGRSRKLRPLVVVKTDDPVRLPPGATLGTPQRRGQGAQLVEASDGLVTLKITKGMGRGKTPTPGAVPEVGERVCYTSLTDDFQGAPSLPDAEATPWTHGGPPQEYRPTDEDAREEWS